VGEKPAMTAAAAGDAAVSQPTVGFDRHRWARFLHDALVPGGWRAGEFDADRWLFTGDPDSPMTTSTRCPASGCEAIVGQRTLCQPCRRARNASGLSEAEFLASHRVPSSAQLPPSELCVVDRDGQRCQRRRRRGATGLCRAHACAWGKRRRRVSFDDWRTRLARPLPSATRCLVSSCAVEPFGQTALCGTHWQLWRTYRSRLSTTDGMTVEGWAAKQSPVLGVHQFSLAEAGPVVRLELLYALQQRDEQGQRLDPTAVKGLIAAVGDLDALATTPYAEMAQRLGPARHVRAYARLFHRVVALKYEEFCGIVHTDKDVWDCLALDLAAPRPGRRPSLATVDFRAIDQQWLRAACKEWVLSARPESNPLQRAVQACELASVALAARPGGGHDESALTFAAMTAVFEQIKSASQANGTLYNSHYRRALWSRFNRIIDFGRAAGLLDRLPATFSRHYSTQRIPDDEINEEQIGKAIPEPVIAQLDAHLDLLAADRRYGMVWSAADTTAMFRTAYVVLRDTGRRPGEVVSLGADCLECDDGQYALIYDNHKKRRLRRRLPITAETAAAIADWQVRRAAMSLPACADRWLFPTRIEKASGPAHLTTNRFGTVIRGWVATIPVLHSDLPGSDGSPLPFDRSLIYPYAFRHSYAQRHADAGVPVEILQELMDHRSIRDTQGYYTVGLKRKREAIKIMSQYVHDRTGSAVPTTGSTGGYQLASVAVPFGNCIEPSNVKAGGKSCPIRFQCSGCGFYRPDPSYLPAIEEHINSLRADKETAAAMDVDDFVARNLSEQADAFARVADTMRAELASLPDTERAEVERASALLRKDRAGRTVLPLTVKERP
jgi:integrase